MNRREAIQKTALTLGYAISAPALAGILNGCKPEAGSSYKPVFLSEGELKTVAELAEIFIPRTRTPGAMDVGVPGFIDVMLQEVYPKNEQERFKKELAEFNELADKTYRDVFADCSLSDQNELVKKVQADALKDQKPERPFILIVKELTLLGFFTSEAGATQVLQYNPVPGPYRGCVPLAEVGKAWAT